LDTAERRALNGLAGRCLPPVVDGQIYAQVFRQHDTKAADAINAALAKPGASK